MSRDITQLHPRLQELLPKLIEECRKRGIYIKIGECMRSVKEQDAIYAQGRTKPGIKVTNARGSSYSSMHQWGVAADFFLDMDVDGDGKKADDAFNNSTSLFEKVGAIGMKLGLEWGGNWKSIKDRPHFQLPDWGSTPTLLKTLYGTPENFKRTWNIGFDFKCWVRCLQTSIGAKVDGYPGPETLGKTPTLKRGSKGPVVVVVQEFMLGAGYELGNYGPNHDGIDGSYGPAFERIVKQYQKDIGMKNQDGILTKGNRTWRTMLRL